MSKTFKEYLLSFHGTDSGLIYNLPKNVRVLLYCQHGKELSACDVNEARTWYVATTKFRDPAGKFLKALKIFDDDDPKDRQYCVFSGNLWRENLNRIPDILLDDEQNDFRTGLFTMPVRFNRIFLKNYYSQTDKKMYRPGQVSQIKPEEFHQKLKPYTKKKAELPHRGFLSYFIRPIELKKKPYGGLDFVIVPNADFYKSHSELKTLTKDIPPSTDPFRVKNDSSIKFDASVINSDKATDIKIVKKIIKSEKGSGVFLSSVIRYLCQENPNTYITIVATVCRLYHPDLTKNLKNNQSKTAEIKTTEYVKKYAKIDVLH